MSITGLEADFQITCAGQGVLVYSKQEQKSLW